MNRLARQFMILFLLSLFFLVGCAEKKKYYRVRDHKPRQSTMGFSIEPPPGKGWYEKHKNNSLIYLKKTDPNKYSLQTKATEIRFSKSIQLKDDFIKYVHNRKVKPLLSSKHKNAKLDYFIETKHSTLCVKYKYSYEDHGYKNLKKNEYVIIINNGLVCKHPNIPTNGIELSYMEKSLSSVHHQSFLKEGEMFLNSLAFHSVAN